MMTLPLICLALTVYYEARSEPLSGQVAVAQIAMNRVRHEDYPDNVCDVVTQGGEFPRLQCQFTWWCDGKSDNPPEEDPAWELALLVASAALAGSGHAELITATHYHADYVDPQWGLTLVAVHGRHRFYE